MDSAHCSSCSCSLRPHAMSLFALTAVPWVYPPLRYSYEWDVVEALFVALVVAGAACAAVSFLLRAKSAWSRAAVVALCACSCIGFQRWVETMCFARVAAPPTIAAVPQLSADDSARLWEYKVSGLPVVVRGVLNDTVSLDRWSPTYLSRRFGHEMVEVQLGNVEQNSTELMNLPLGEFLDGMLDEEWLRLHARHGGKLPYYAEADSLFESQPELGLGAKRLLQALQLDTVGAFHYQTLFWIGPAGALTGLHMDMDATNFLFQVHGSKRFWLYPIQQSPLVYPSTKYDMGASLAQVDHFSPDLDRFPSFARAQPLVVDVHAGDVLYVPSYWYHAVRSTTASVSVSVRLFTVCEALAVAPLTWLDHLHNWGLYRHDDCVCHNPNSAPY